MTDIRFDLNYMHTLQGEFIKSEGEVSSCAHGFVKIAQKMESELSSFNAECVKSVREIQAQIFEIRDLRSEIDRKSANAKSKKQKEIEIPSKPSVPPSSTSEQRSAVMSAYNNKVSQIESQNAKIRAENRRIDEYIEKCESAKAKLEEIISKLHQLEESVKKEIEHTASSVHGFMGQANGIKNDFARASTAMGEFNHAFKEAYESAQMLCDMNPTAIRSFSYMDKQFVIKNTHSHVLGSGSFVGFNYSDGEESNSSFKEEKSKKSPEATELLIKEKDEESFFESIDAAKKIKMPSANLHKLGGKRFTAKMNQRGYTLMAQGDGSFIDGSGMLHWEKKDD